MPVLRCTLVAGLVAAFAGPALAAYFNVSELVTGTAHVNRTLVVASKIPCGSACTYRSQSSAGMRDGFAIAPDDFVTDNWALAFASGGAVHTPPQVAWTVAVPPAPGGAGQLGGVIGVHERSRVRWENGAGTADPRQLTVQTWKSGTGGSVVSYAIRLAPTSGGTKPTFLTFKVPTRLNAYSNTSYVLYDQPFDVDPVRVLSRAAVDVYVDGLPVWSSEVNSLLPKRYYMPPSHLQLQLSWDQPLDGADVTLFLGNLPSGSSRTVAVTMRSDLRVEASCRTTGDNYGVQHQSCHSQREGLELPGVESGGAYRFVSPDVQLYTK